MDSKPMSADEIAAVRERCEALLSVKWTYDQTGQLIWAENPFGHGLMRLLDLRGWGHLTGSGTCNMGNDDAAAIQDALGSLLAQFPRLLATLGARDERLRQAEGLMCRLEWSGPSDYSIGLPTCPVCHAMTKGRSTSGVVGEGKHRAGCALSAFLGAKEASHD